MKKRTKTPDYTHFIITVLFVILFAFISIAYFSSWIDDRPTDQQITQEEDQWTSDNLVTFLKDGTIIKPQIYEDSPVLGQADASVTIFQYACFSCDYSAAVQPIIDQIMAKYPSEVKLVWKDLPIPAVYPDSPMAHRAGRCANEQNKFWQYHDLLWQNQDNFDINNLKKMADQINLNAKQFDSCMQTKAVDNLIDQDVKEADQLYISGTPHFYINDQELVGTVTEADFVQLIEVELSRQ